MFAFADASMIPQLQELWKLCFGDDEAYSGFFFREHPWEHTTPVLLRDGKPVSMVNLLPMELRSGEKTWSACYVYAVATHPEYRGQGLSTALMDHTLRALREDGFAAAVLVPASKNLFRFYERQGYRTAFYRRTCLMREEPGEAVFPELCPGSFAELKPLRDEYFAKSSLYSCWDASALDYVQREAGLQGGEFLTFPGGYALCFPREDRVEIKELIAGSWTEGQLAGALHQRYGQKELYLRRWAGERGNASPLPYGMICWLGSERARQYEIQGENSSYFALALD